MVQHSLIAFSIVSAFLFLNSFPWSNGINERNHASCDLTIKKLMEDKKIGLTDTLVKTAAWTHNTNVNKARFPPLTLVTGKAVNIPGLTMDNEVSESLTDAE